jgi:hypothetical protein
VTKAGNRPPGSRPPYSPAPSPILTGPASSCVPRTPSTRCADATGDSDLRTIGSLSLVQQFLRARLVDHRRLTIFPLVIGETGEQPLFRQVGDFELHLQGRTVLDDRIVLLDYRPGGEPPYSG